jgi:iron complex transport system substrate-binding protein
MILSLIAGCGGEDVSKERQLTLHPLAIRYAGGFRLDTAAGIVRATVLNPWQGDEKATINYLLVRNKKDLTLPGGISLVTPVRRVVCTSTTHVAFLTALGQRNSIVAVSGKDYICDTLLRRRLAAGEVKDIGYDKNMNYELILQLRPDVVFLYGIGPSVTGTVDRLASLGIPAVVVGDYLEQTPLGRAEWLRFFGAFFGMFDSPARHLDSLAAAYEQLQKHSPLPEGTPHVMTGLPWNEIWYVPGGRSLTAALIRDAGGCYVWDHLATTDALPMDIEKVFEKAGEADIWINCGSATSLQEILAADKRLALFRPVKDKRVYNNDARLNEKGGNDYWESGVLHPDIILEDLKKIFRGEEEGLVYYRKME